MLAPDSLAQASEMCRVDGASNERRYQVTG
jgi:hypothetical protein